MSLLSPCSSFLQAEAFGGWLARHQESRSKRQLLLSFVESLQQGLLGRTFRSWATHTVEHARLRSTAATCLARMQCTVQHRAFACWQQGAHGAAEARHGPRPTMLYTRLTCPWCKKKRNTGLLDQLKLRHEVSLRCSGLHQCLALTADYQCQQHALSVLEWSWSARAGQNWRAAVRIGSGRRWRAPSKDGRCICSPLLASAAADISDNLLLSCTRAICGRVRFAYGCTLTCNLAANSTCHEQETVHWRVHKREALRGALASLTQRHLLADLLAWRHRTNVLVARHVVL